MDYLLRLLTPRRFASAVPADAQHGSVAAYPGKPIRFIVPGVAGGPSDTLARIIGEKLTAAWGQAMVYELTGPTDGLRILARAPADGYTIAMSGGAYYINASIYRKLPFDPVNDFAPLSLVASICNILVVHPSVPVHSVDELIAYAKSRPGELRYASSGHGDPPHLAGELFKVMAGIDIVHVAYNGHIAAEVALAGGRDVQLMFDATPTALPHIEAGELRGLAVTTAKRVASLPDLPTLAECGLSGYEINPAVGVLAPAGTPDAIVARLGGEIAAIMRLPDVQARLRSARIEPLGTTPGEYADYMKTAFDKWAEVVRMADIEILEAPKS